MAIAWVQTVTGTLTSGGTATITGVAAGSLLVLSGCNKGAATAASASDAQGSYTSVSPPGAINSGGNAVQALYLPNANAGTHTITVTSAGGESWGWAITEYSGVASASPVFASVGQDLGAPGTGAGAITSGTFNSGASHTVVGFSWCTGGTDTGMSAASGTQRANVTLGPNGSVQFIQEDQASIGAGDAATFTSSNGASFHYGTTAIALAPPSGGNTGTIAWFHN